jgi:hypothetical protein
MRKIRYSIIGCGNVAGDYKNKQKIAGIYTHADAFSRIKAFKPIACFDLYYKKSLQKLTWKATKSINQAMIDIKETIV